MQRADDHWPCTEMSSVPWSLWWLQKHDQVLCVFSEKWQEHENWDVMSKNKADEAFRMLSWLMMALINKKHVSTWTGMCRSSSVVMGVCDAPVLVQSTLRLEARSSTSRPRLAERRREDSSQAWLAINRSCESQVPFTWVRNKQRGLSQVPLPLFYLTIKLNRVSLSIMIICHY